MENLQALPILLDALDDLEQKGTIGADDCRELLKFETTYLIYSYQQSYVELS